MQKRFLKYLLILTALAGGTMIVLYAQNGYVFKEQVAEKNIEDTPVEEEQADDIGMPTTDDPWKEMDKLVEAYYSNNGVHFKGVIKLIDDNGEKEKIIEEQNFEYAVLGENFYYSLGNMEGCISNCRLPNIIVGSGDTAHGGPPRLVSPPTGDNLGCTHMEFVNKQDLILVADHNNKFISVSPVVAAANRPKKLFDIAAFKKLMEERKANAKVTQLGNQKILTIENIQDPQVQGYRIYYDPSTYRISKMMIGMLRLSPLGDDEGGIDEVPEPPAEIENNSNDNKTDELEIDTYTYYMEIIYTETKILDMTKAGFNPENKFIIRKKDKIELSPAFRTYQLIGSVSL